MVHGTVVVGSHDGNGVADGKLAIDAGELALLTALKTFVYTVDGGN